MTVRTSGDDNRAMPKTLLAVDDSVTMRKVVELTFAGEDIRVVTVATAQDALASCRKERPDIVLADVALEGHSGYDLCRAIKDEFSGVPVVILSSKQNPFDPARGQASGADANLDKPYDTAKAIELVKKTLEQGKSVAPAPIAAAPVAGAPAAPRAPMFSSPQAAAPAPPPQPARPVAMPPTPQPHSTVQGMPATKAQPPAAAAPRPAPPAPTPDPGPALIRQPTPALQRQGTVKMISDAPPAAQVQHGTLAELAQSPPTNGGGGGVGPELGAKLQQLGLTSQQVDAVLALSREVVEKVVWEVVPILAETMVKEEIARLTRDS